MTKNLGEIIDISAVQSLMDDFYHLTKIGVAILDLEGHVLVATGWQDICTRFHRVHPETAARCRESDLYLSRDIPPGEIRGYKCMNNLWDFVTPLFIDGSHKGNLYLGQFFFDDEEIDYALFDGQAARYGFNKEEYRAALERVPRWSRERVYTVLRFYRTLAQMISGLAYEKMKQDRELRKQQAAQERLERLNEELRRAYHSLSVTEKELEERYKELEEKQIALAESEERYRSIIEHMLDIFYRTDQQGNLVMISPSALAIFGYESEEEMLGKNIAENFYLCPKDREVFLSNLRRTGQVKDYELYLKHRDGTPIPVATSSRFYHDKEGNILGVEGFFRDIRERKRNEEERRRRDDLEKSILKSVPHALFGVENRRIFFANAAMEEVFGWKPEELLGQSTRILFRNDEEWEAYGEFLYSRLSDTPTLVFDAPYPFVRKDGKEIFCRNSIACVGDQLGTTKRIVASFEDITERRRAVEALKRSEQKYRLLFEKATQGILIAREERIQYVNPTLLAIMGYPEDVVTTRPFVDFIHPDDRDLVRDRHLRRLRGEDVETNYT
ncbi:MAG: PAS domain S-box protein, partial [Syntrophales bacterium]|nr:PAS domain S-box protein [Syntrophales bacterium]